MQVHSLVDSHIILGEMVPFFFLLHFQSRLFALEKGNQDEA